MSAPVHPANGSPFEPGEEILWWQRPISAGSRRGYLVRRFARPAIELGTAGLAALLTFGVLLPLLHHIRVEMAPWLLPLLVGAGLAASAWVLLTAMGVLALLMPEPHCPPPPRVVTDLLYVFTDRRLLVLRTSRGSGRAYERIDLVPVDATPPTYRIDEIEPGIGNILVGVPGPAGWVSRMSLWSMADPVSVAARLRDWVGDSQRDGQPTQNPAEQTLADDQPASIHQPDTGPDPSHPASHAAGRGTGSARRSDRAADDSKQATVIPLFNRRRRRGRHAAQDSAQRRDSTFLA